jgi:excisionase family DNA binding protein
MEQLLMAVDEVAQAMGVCRSKVYAMIANGELRSVRLGRSVRIPVGALREWVDVKVGAQMGTMELTDQTKVRS